MRRALPPALGPLVIVGVIAVSVFLFGHYEGDGGSDYEKILGEDAAVPTVSFACFPRPPEEREIAELNENPDSENELVPGKPERLLLCRYRGMNFGKRSLRLATSKLDSDPERVRLIADGLNELPPFPDGVHTCPFDEGARTYALFAYPNDAPVVVELRFEGCSVASNGRADVTQFGGPVARQVMNFVPLSSGR